MDGRSHSPTLMAVAASDCPIPVPEGDSSEGQDGWIYSITEDYVWDLLTRARDGESLDALMLELWVEAETDAA